MKKQIFAVTLISAALGFASCEKNEVGNPVGSFNAFSETSGSAKTHLEPDVANHAFNVMWDQNDEIKVYDASGNSATYSTQGDDVEAAAFTATSGTGVAEGSTYTAFYPASISPTSSSSVTLPTTQPYKAISTDAAGYYGYVTGFPMAANTSTNSDNNYASNDLYFKNLCGLCVLRLKGPSGATVNSITLSEPTYPYTAATALTGTFDVSWENGLPKLSATTPASIGGQESVTLSGCNITLDNNYGLFYFYLPEGQHQWLNVKVDYTLGSTTNTFSRTILASTYGGSITSFDFTRSRWTALDVDLSSDMDNTSGTESYGLVYAADDLVFGTDDAAPIINTNHRITNTQSAYTILIDATPSVLDDADVSSSDGSRYYTLYNDMDDTSDWNGIVIRYQKTSSYNLSINAEGPQSGNDYADKLAVGMGATEDSIAIGAGTRNRMAVVIGSTSDTNSSMVYTTSSPYYHLFANAYSNSSWSATVHMSAEMSWDNWQANDNHPAGYVRAVVGGDQSDVDGGRSASTLKHNFHGTIHKIRIYNRVLTQTERQNWFRTGSITGSTSSK